MSETESVREKLELTLVGIKAKAGCVLAAEFKITFRSEERRVGKECLE